MGRADNMTLPRDAEKLLDQVRHLTNRKIAGQKSYIVTALLRFAAHQCREVTEAMLRGQYPKEGLPPFMFNRHRQAGMHDDWAALIPKRGRKHVGLPRYKALRLVAEDDTPRARRAVLDMETEVAIYELAALARAISMRHPGGAARIVDEFYREYPGIQPVFPKRSYERTA